MLHTDTSFNAASVIDRNTISIKQTIDLKSSPLSSSEDPDLLILDGDESNSSSTSTGHDTLNEVLSLFTGDLKPEGIDSYSEGVFDDLNEALQHNSPISMLPNFNINPSGKELGKYVVIDLGGSTLRTSVVEIRNPLSENDNESTRSSRVHIVNEKKWIVSNNDKLIDNKFFKFIGSKIIETIEEQDVIRLDDDIIEVGITWSFPLDQVSHNTGRIVHVGKGWVISDEIYNKDLKLILESVMKESYGLNTNVKAVINDSLAVYASGKFLSSNLKLAMVLGTGFNMCCSLDTSDQMHESKTLGEEAVLFNSETSLFGSSLFSLSNEFDTLIDDRFSKFERSYKSHMTTDDPSKVIYQPFEIMTSGRYLPELTRLSLVKLYNNQNLFRGLEIPQSSKLFVKYDGLSSELLCFISENDHICSIRKRFSEEFDLDINNEDALKIKQVTDSVIRRASYIVAIAIASFIKLLMKHTQEDFTNKKIIIGYVGSIMEYFNHYRNLILKHIAQSPFVKELGITVDLMSIQNSSIVGAAVSAAYFKD